jgi:hypothetical protein
MNENTGSTAADSGSAPVNGTLKGSPTWGTGKYGAALTFGKSNQFVSVGNAHLNGATQLTFEVWLKRKAANGIVAVGEESIASHLDASIEAYSDGKIYFNIGTGSTIADAFFASNDTNWHHVAYVFDGTQANNASRLKAYLDGVQQTLNFDGTTVPTSLRTNDSNFSIGALSSVHDFSNGTLDDVRIYAYPRTLAQIVRDMNNNI